MIKQGRKFGITLILDTQSPTATSIPREVTRNMSCGVAFSVADHIANDGLLGSGKYRAGVRATDLRMHTDRGTSVMVGVSDATFELVRGFYVPYSDGVDMVAPVVNRAMAAIDQLRCTGGPTTGDDDQDDDVGQVDHLADIHEALRGERRVRTQVVLTRLVELTPVVYEGWTFQDLSAALSDFDIEPVKSGGVKVVRATDVTHALTYRDRHRNTEGDKKGRDLRRGPGRGPGEFSPPASPPLPPHLTSPNHHQGPTPSRAQQRRKPRKTGVGAATGWVPPSPNPHPH